MGCAASCSGDHLPPPPRATTGKLPFELFRNLSAHERRELSDSMDTVLPSSPALADCAVKLDSTIEAAGQQAVDAVAQVVLGVFAGCDQFSVPELDTLLGIFDLAAMREEILSKSEYKSVKALVNDVAKGVKQNPILVQVLAEMSKCEHQLVPPQSRERDQEIRTAVVYTFLLHTLTKMMVDEPIAADCLMRKVLEKCNRRSEEVDWKPYFNPFERMKLPSIEFPMGNYTRYKCGDAYVVEEGSGALLAINILEAIYQDTRLGDDANAAAGYELMMEPNERTHIPGLENDVNRLFNEKTAAVCNKPPFPREWANLYSSWNLCFGSNYKDYPMYFAKLLAPVVLTTYQNVDPGLYLYPRVLALYLHLQYLKFSRAAHKSAEPNGMEWRSERMVVLWGLVNQMAAQEFQRRVRKTIKERRGEGQEVAYAAERLSVRMHWEVLRRMINTSTALGDAAEEAVEELDMIRAKLFGRELATLLRG
eukprot:RCo046302